MIMLVDDSADIRAIMSSILRHLGHNVHICSDARAALEDYEVMREKPEIIFMDVDMPGMNGVEAAQKLLWDFPDQKLVMFTGVEDKKVLRPAFSAGACCFLRKPFTPESVKRCIENVRLGRCAAENGCVAQDMCWLKKIERAGGG